MNLIRIAIDRPIAVLSAVLMVVMFGFVALQTIPIQLAPDVRKPVIEVTTQWGGGAPAEIEREVVNRQEEVLRGLEGLEQMTSRSEDGRGRVTLEFGVAQNMDKAMLLVANRLDRVSSYPDEADEPTLDTSGSDDSPIAWFVLTRQDGNDRLIHEYGDFVEDVVKDRLERVPGVSRINVYGGSEREMRVVVDPERMARYRLTVPDILRALRNADASVSAGAIDEGKRRYVVRTEGDLNTLDQVRNVVLRSERSDGSGRLGRVTVGDISEVRFDYKEPVARIRLHGEPAMAMNAVRETGANVIETMKGIREAITELNDYALPNAGLKVEQVYDETIYINSAIDLVTQNIYVGGTLAAIVLLIFLRSFGATLIISMAIPVSVIGSFVAMAALGRSINVISLAGLAFAVGMVVDAAIVVLENIYRLRQEGKPIAEAAYKGAAEVWGAILVSALTTVMVFIPILVMQLEVGQLFRDIAVAISVAVLLSLLVAVTVIPALSKKLLGDPGAKSIVMKRLPLIDGMASVFVRAVIGFTRWVVRSWARSILVVATVSGAAVAISWAFLPKLEYLPDGNRNLLLGFMLPPPGYNLETTTEIATEIENAMRPHWAVETGPESAPGEPPKMSRFFFVAFSRQYHHRDGGGRREPGGGADPGGEPAPVLRTGHLRFRASAIGLRARHRRRPLDRPRYFRSGSGTGHLGGGPGHRDAFPGSAAGAGQPAPTATRAGAWSTGSAPGAGPHPAGGQRRHRDRPRRDGRRLQRRAAGRGNHRGRQAYRPDPAGTGPQHRRDAGRGEPAGGDGERADSPGQRAGGGRDYRRPDRDPPCGAAQDRHPRDPAGRQRAPGDGHGAGRDPGDRAAPG